TSFLTLRVARTSSLSLRREDMICGAIRRTSASTSQEVTRVGLALNLSQESQRFPRAKSPRPFESSIRRSPTRDRNLGIAHTERANEAVWSGSTSRYLS